METQPDLPGWANTTWGMTEEEILNLPQLNATKSSESIEIRNKDVGGIECNIWFVFDDKGGLKSVGIQPVQQDPDGCFEHFYELLEKKYGPAYKQIEPDEITREVIWKFPSTVIELKELDALDSLGILNLYLTYKKYEPVFVDVSLL